MPKHIPLEKKISGVLFWSIISAAFIGPGTVTTASKAGASFGTSLLWALLFSTIATIILQESAARITIATNKNLGEVIVLKYQHAKKWRIPLLLFLGIFIGCSAYEAGNILGAVAGLQLLSNIHPAFFIILLSVTAGLLLWFGTYRSIANVMGIIVALMGMIFLIAAFSSEISFAQILKSAVVPSFPGGSSLLIISLIGTTIVPYNLFLASGISQGQDIREMRFGIILAVFIGGIISMAILISGTLVNGEFSFEAIATSLEGTFGPLGKSLFAIGLFAAGFTSTITAPLAAAITGKSLLASASNHWPTNSWSFRSVWIIVITFGLFFGLTGVKPIPAIILAQAANGVLLPLFTSFLFLVMNDHALLQKRFTNGMILNIVMLSIVGITSFLGFNNLLNALTGVFPSMALSKYFREISSVASLIVLILLTFFWLRNRYKQR
jgi:Mn2+/Fe2+ NRAMP family transporter